MATIKKFSTTQRTITLSLNISNVIEITPFFTKVELEILDGKKIHTIPLTTSFAANENDNTGNIPAYSISNAVNYKNGILIFATSFKYDTEDTVVDRINQLELTYKLEENGNTKTFNTFDARYIAPGSKIIKIVKNIELS